MLLVSSKLAFFLCSKKIPAGERTGCKSNGNSMTRIARRTPRHSCPQRVMPPLNESCGLFGRYYLLVARNLSIWAHDSLHLISWRHSQSNRRMETQAEAKWRAKVISRSADEVPLIPNHAPLPPPLNQVIAPAVPTIPRLANGSAKGNQKRNRNQSAIDQRAETRRKKRNGNQTRKRKTRRDIVMIDSRRHSSSGRNELMDHLF